MQNTQEQQTAFLIAHIKLVDGKPIVDDVIISSRGAITFPVVAGEEAWAEIFAVQGPSRREACAEMRHHVQHITNFAWCLPFIEAAEEMARTSFRQRQIAVMPQEQM